MRVFRSPLTGYQPTDVPAWVIFHAMFGYVLLLVGLLAMTLRLPLKSIRKRRWLHRYLGYVWIFGTVWMPVTAIWCVRSSFGWSIIAFFIFSMVAYVYTSSYLSLEWKAS